MQCPLCKKPVDEKGKYFPFCCERCRLIDLGRWLGGKYQIPVVEDDLDESPPETDKPPKSDDHS